MSPISPTNAALLPEARPLYLQKHESSFLPELDTLCHIDPNTGLVNYDDPQITQLLRYREATLTGVLDSIRQPKNDKTLIAGFHLLEKLKTAGVAGVDHAYAVTYRYNNHPNPLVQQALAHFYATLDITCAFGPSLVNLQKAAKLPASVPSALNPAEAWGHAVLDQVSKTSAKAVLDRLIPVFEANNFIVPASVKAGQKQHWQEFETPGTESRSWQA